MTVSVRVRPSLTAAAFLIVGLFGSMVPVPVAAQNAPAEDTVICEPDKVCRDTKTRLPLMALPRPFSNIYTSRETGAHAVYAENVRPFYPLYVFDRSGLDLSDPANPEGWYQVGVTVKRAVGWMQARDLLEWRQALVVAYTHPGSGDDARHPVLMFNELERLQTVVESTDREMAASALYETLDQGGVPEGVVSSEAKKFRDIDKDFYIFPVVDFKEVFLFDDPARYLQVAAAIPQERSTAGGETVLDNEAFLAEVRTEGTVGAGAPPNVDIVFVMDMTSSMGPYIDATKEAMGRIARLVLDKVTDRSRIRFGLVGYRDNVQQMPDLEFTARNFTPTLVDDQALVDLLTFEAKAAPSGSRDYAEEVYAGVSEGLNSAWSGDRSLKFVILVGDASAHEPDHDQATTQLGAAELRGLADQLKVKIASIHLSDPRAAADHATAEQQFRTLALNPGAEVALYYDISTDDLGRFEDTVSKLAGSLAAIINATADGGTGGTAAQVAKQAVQMGSGGSGVAPAGADALEQQALEKTIETALVEYLGDQAQAPRDIIAWTFDRDLVDPTRKALSVRVLLNREQLNNLIIALEAVVTALKEAELTQAEFFGALQAVVTQTIKTADDIDFEKAKRLSETRLMPSWIESLPYQSQILAMSNEMYEQLTPDERVALERNLSNKLALYREINESTGLWHALAEDQASLREVTPLMLEMLP